MSLTSSSFSKKVQQGAEQQTTWIKTQLFLSIQCVYILYDFRNDSTE